MGSAIPSSSGQLAEEHGEAVDEEHGDVTPQPPRRSPVDTAENG
jgi:hypothetical protein